MISRLTLVVGTPTFSSLSKSGLGKAGVLTNSKSRPVTPAFSAMMTTDPNGYEMMKERGREVDVGGFIF
jgi:hypothetical protein